MPWLVHARADHEPAWKAVPVHIFGWQALPLLAIKEVASLREPGSMYDVHDVDFLRAGSIERSFAVARTAAGSDAIATPAAYIERSAPNASIGNSDANLERR